MPPEKAVDGELVRRRLFIDWSKIALNLLLPVAGVLVALLIGGIDLSATTKRKWYRRTVAEAVASSQNVA